MIRRTIGLIADTHGLLRPEALAALRGVDQLIHAGDIGGPQILAELERLAPLSVVRGNNDNDAWAQGVSAFRSASRDCRSTAARYRQNCWNYSSDNPVGTGLAYLHLEIHRSRGHLPFCDLCHA